MLLWLLRETLPRLVIHPVWIEFLPKNKKVCATSRQPLCTYYCISAIKRCGYTINFMRLPPAPATADQEQCLVQSTAANRWYWQSIMHAERIGGCSLNNVASRFSLIGWGGRNICYYSLSVMMLPVLRLGLSTEAGNGPRYLNWHPLSHQPIVAAV